MAKAKQLNQRSSETDMSELSLQAELESSLTAFADLHFRLTADGTYVRVWAADPAALIVPPEQIPGTNIAEYFPPELAERMLDSITLTIATGKVTSVEYSFGEDDDTRHYEARLAPLGADEVMAVVRETTSLKDLEQQLIHAQTMQSVGRLAGGIAHDFNNVLHVVRGHAEALGLHRADPQELERRIAAITRAVDRTSSLVERLLILSRPTHNNPTPSNVDQFLRSLGPTLSQLLGETIELEFVLDSNDCAVAIDDSRFENVLLNLATNALDAMPHGGALRIQTRARANTVVIEVADTGDGIDGDVLPRIFEPFFTTKAVGIGTGLGLATTYTSITDAAGTITVESERGDGTTFTIRLPVTTDQPASAGPTSDTTVHDTNVTVLVVEDDPDVRELCVDTLCDLGYRVVEATDGTEALTAIADGEPIDLLLTDVVMPGMSGPEIASEIGRRYGPMPTVYMTGYEQQAQRVDAIDSPSGLLRKPFTREELSAAVHAQRSTVSPDA